MAHNEKEPLRGQSKMILWLTFPLSRGPFLGFFLAKMCNNLKMTEAQQQIVEAYKEMVGNDVVTKKDLKEWTSRFYPITANSQPKLKPDRDNTAGIVPGYARMMLPPVEYNMVSW
jgi:hypothetical protein